MCFYKGKITVWKCSDPVHNQCLQVGTNNIEVKIYKDMKEPNQIHEPVCKYGCQKRNITICNK